MHLHGDARASFAMLPPACSGQWPAGWLPSASLALTLAALLVAATASPQSPGGASAPATLSPANAPKESLPRPDKNRAQTAYQAGRRAEQAGDWKTAYAAYSEATAYAPANKEYSAAAGTLPDFN